MTQDLSLLLPKPVGFKQRDIITMSDQETADYLSHPHALTASTVTAAGTIHSVAMWYAYLDGLIYMEAKEKSQKIRNLVRDPRITLLIHSGTTYTDLQGVMIVGRAEIITDDDSMMRRVVSDILRRYQHIQSVDEEVVQGLIRKRVLIRVAADQVSSWDHRKLT